ncbi:DUF5825 family protein [Nonomuraea guangzhouensis]|uniref:DUF5825 family protein n=1 Tax=Nonomuraea guangzhouensis TaxID=1291555 RepID=A0ABW4GYG4_9ACTN|nr:DUF5825 family protein [Nonomuraea guangzhouensis]
MSGPPACVPLTLWKDRDPAAMRVPGMYAGRVEATGDPVATVSRVAEDGVQLARLEDTVDLEDADGAAAVAALTVIRELTSHGIAVDWTIHMPAGTAGWRPLSHLHPPTAVYADSTEDDVVGSAADGVVGSAAGGVVGSAVGGLVGSVGDGIAAAWRESFHIAKCGYRLGPGFIEIRDRRTGSFKRLVIRNPHREEAIAPLLRGVRVTALSPAVTERYLRADLLHRVGGFVWWTPYRIRRWPLSSTIP